MSNLNGFSISVPEAQEETSDGYVVLKHNEHFRIRLHNAHKDCGIGKPADCEVYLQGKYVGTYRIPYSQTIILEHPINDNGKFTAYRNGTLEAQQAEINPDSPENGLIKVVWKPGTKKVSQLLFNHIINLPRTNINDFPGPYDYTPTYYNYNTSTTGPMKSCINRSCSVSNDLCGGGIGLSGHSDQLFTETDALDYDECETTIYLRIAFKENQPRPISTCKVYKTAIPRPLK